MEIRRAQAPDLAAAATLWYERMALLRESEPGLELAPDASDHWLGRAKTWINDADYAFLVAVADGRIIGLAVVTTCDGLPGLMPDRKGVLMQLAVDLHHQHGGLPGRLIKAAKAWLRSCDVSVLQVDAPVNYPVEDVFWRAQGASLCGRQYRLRL